MNNLPTFDEVMVLTNTISVHNILEPVECKALYDACCEIPDGSTVVEIGCDLGRSSSLIQQIAKAKDFVTIHVDPWLSEPFKAKQWMALMCQEIDYFPFIVLRMTTEEAATAIDQLTPHGIDLAFIDGCHDEPVVLRDLEIVAFRVKSGGFLTAHDYPSGGVSEAIDGFIARGGWTKHNQAGGFGVWRRK